MAATQGAPGASLVSLVTASLRNDRHLHVRDEARTPEEGETPVWERRDIFSSASSFPRARPSVTASPSPTTTPAPGLPDRVHIASASSSDRRSVARGDAHVGPPGDDTRAAGAHPQPVHSYFARQLEGCGDRPAHALEMLRDAAAYLRRNRLVEMKKAAKAEATRKRLHSLLEAGEALSERNFPGLAYKGSAHATGPEESSGERELRRLFPGGALYVDDRPRAMLSNARSSFDDDDDDEEDEEDTEDEDSEGETEDVKTEKETEFVTHTEPPKQLPKRRERPNESATAAAARYANSAVPTAPPRALPFITGGIQVIAIGSVVPELSGRFSAQSKYVLPLGFTTRRRYTSSMDPTRKVWYESRVCEASGNASGNAEANGNVTRGKREPTGFVVVVSDVDEPSLTWRGECVNSLPSILKYPNTTQLLTTHPGTSPQGTSPTHAWQQVIAAVNVRAMTRKKPAVSGPQFLGEFILVSVWAIRMMPCFVHRLVAAGGCGGDREAARIRSLRRRHEE